MPLGPGVKYRVHTTKTGQKVRLAFKGGKVIEAKNLQSGATHTPADFAADRARSKPTRSLAHTLTALRGAGKFQTRA
jgi:hypothetical protein